MVDDASHLADGQRVFDAFVAFNHALYPPSGAGAKGRLSASSARLYASFWRAWVRFVSRERGRPWHQADVDDVEAFFASVRPRTPRRERASGVTRQRYETVLSRVYAFALSQHRAGAAAGVAAPRDNPVRLTNPERYSAREKAGSFLLQPDYRARLLAGIDALAAGTAARDAAALALMAAQGLTPQELRALQCSDVQWADGQSPAASWPARLERWPEVPEPHALHVAGSGAAARLAQPRTLELDALSRRALRQWLEWRGPHVRPGSQALLFCGQRGALSNTSLYEVAKAHIQAVLMRPRAGHAALEPRLLHTGPMALRNAAIMAWVESIDDVAEVCRRAGLGPAKSLARFAEHASPGARGRIERAIAQDSQTSGEPVSAPASAP